LALIFVLYRMGCFILWHLFRKCPVCRKNRLTHSLPFYAHNIRFFWCDSCGVLAYHKVRCLLFSTGSTSVLECISKYKYPFRLKFLSGIKGEVGVRVDSHTIDLYKLPSGSDINDYSAENIFVSTRSACTQGDGSTPTLYKTTGLVTREGECYCSKWC